MGAAATPKEPQVEEIQICDEAVRILQWRRDELFRGGYPDEWALSLSFSKTVDIHRACDLLRQGCPVSVAVKILS